MMTYGKSLPRIDNILWLKALSRPFPATTADILEKARLWHFSTNTIDFLKLFPENEIFESEEEFLTRCEELEMMIREERAMPIEGMLSPQD